MPAAAASPCPASMPTVAKTTQAPRRVLYPRGYLVYLGGYLSYWGKHPKSATAVAGAPGVYAWRTQ
jgi:hypothetical protein